jgi:hypothetical protein
MTRMPTTWRVFAVWAAGVCLCFAMVLLPTSRENYADCESLYIDFKRSVLHESVEWSNVSNEGGYVYYEGVCRIRYKGNWLDVQKARQLINTELGISNE